jgi:hypothetical protein
MAEEIHYALRVLSNYQVHLDRWCHAWYGISAQYIIGTMLPPIQDTSQPRAVKSFTVGQMVSEHEVGFFYLTFI